MMFSLPSPLTSPRTDDAACVPDVDWDGAAALVGDWLPCGLPALPTDSPFGAIRVPELLPQIHSHSIPVRTARKESFLNCFPKRSDRQSAHPNRRRKNFLNCFLKTCPVPSPDR